MRITRKIRLATLGAACLAALGAQFGVQLLTAGPASASTGAAVYTATSANNSEGFRMVNAQCPSGKRVLGGGGRVINGGGQVVLSSMSPYHSSDRDGYVAVGIERPGGYSANWYVIGYAVCGYELDGLEIVTTTATSPSGGQFKSATAECSSGKAPIGSGAATGHVDRGVGIQSVMFAQIGEGRYGVRASAAEDRGDGLAAPADWGVTAWAVCSYKPYGYQIVSVYSPDHTSNLASAKATCPTGKTALGAGTILVDYTYLDHLSAMFVSGSYGYVVANRRASSTSSWHIYGYAVCAY
jgi:hypothetical protein